MISSFFVTVCDDGDLGVACTAGSCVASNHEICDTVTTNQCKCDAGYTAGTSDTAMCFQDCPADPGFAHGTLSGDQHYEGTATITCDSGYTAGAGGGGGSITCKNDGTWDTTGATACTAVDCGNPSAQAGYSIAGSGTTYQSTRTVTCDTGNGYTGTPPTITCEASGSWTAFSGCTTGGGTVDCGNPPSKAGYVPETSPASTLQGATVSVTCAVNYKGTAAQITCEASGSWSDYSGCSSAGTRIKLDFSLITVFAVLMLVLI